MPSLWLLLLPSLSTFHFPLPLPLPSLHLCHCCHAHCFCQCNRCCRCPLLFCPRTDCHLFAIIVYCAYSLTMQQARTRSLTLMVTCLPCCMHKLVSLNTLTMKYSAASWRARRAELCIRRSLFLDMLCTISCTRCWKGAFLMRRSVVFWIFWISLRATVPGHQRQGFLMAIAFCAAAHAAFVAK
jgi:hypothetical protein